MHISTPSLIKGIVNPNGTSLHESDIVKHISKPTLHLCLIYENVCKYPKGCSLYFKGYNGTKDAKILTSDIIRLASVCGTSLCVLTNQSYQQK